MISMMKNLDNLFYKIHFCKFSYKLANLTIYSEWTIKLPHL